MFGCKCINGAERPSPELAYYHGHHGHERKIDSGRHKKQTMKHIENDDKTYEFLQHKNDDKTYESLQHKNDDKTHVSLQHKDDDKTYESLEHKNEYVSV